MKNTTTTIVSEKDGTRTTMTHKVFQQGVVKIEGTLTQGVVKKEVWIVKTVDCSFGYCCERLYKRGVVFGYEKMWHCKKCKADEKEMEKEFADHTEMIDDYNNPCLNKENC